MMSIENDSCIVNSAHSSFYLSLVLRWRVEEKMEDEIPGSTVLYSKKIMVSRPSCAFVVVTSGNTSRLDRDSFKKE